MHKYCKNWKERKEWDDYTRGFIKEVLDKAKKPAIIGGNFRVAFQSMDFWNAVGRVTER